MSKVDLLLFGVYPYIALAICLLGSWARFDLSQYSWRAGSSQLMNRNPAEQRYMRIASNLFHVGVLFVLAGHFVGLLTPASVYHYAISTENKQLLAMVSGGFFGVLCLIVPAPRISSSWWCCWCSCYLAWPLFSPRPNIWTAR